MTWRRMTGHMVACASWRVEICVLIGGFGTCPGELERWTSAYSRG